MGKKQQGEASSGGDRVPGTTLPNLGGMSATAPVAMQASGKEDSTTVSAISQGALTVTDSDQQQALTGKDAAATVATLNRDVHVDENGHAVDSQGNSTANTITPIFDDEKRAEINAGFEIVRAFSNESSTFLANRARESDQAEKEIKAELAKDQPDQNRLNQLSQIVIDNQTWAMGGTGRTIITALTAAASGNVTGSSGEFIQAATVNYLQSLGAQQIKQIADQIGGEGSAAHTALHAVLACGGAAASGGDCGTATLASSAGVVINKLMDGIEGKDSANLTAEEREARRNLVTSLVTGITVAAGGDAVIANAAASIETENNGLLNLIEKGLDNYKEIKEGYKKLNDMKKFADMSIKNGVMDVTAKEVVLDEEQTKQVFAKFFPNDQLPTTITDEDKAFAQFLVLQSLKSSYSLAIVQGIGEAATKNPVSTGLDILKSITFSATNKTYSVDGESKIYLAIQNVLTLNMRSEYVNRLNGDSYTVINIKN
ncbi:hypothetical protein [Methylobacillus sp. Pita1]|uniref:hypothetical protein n=1 Tax=Methylobacillus sp. Pita1 TaxID=3382642 RepID=UPI0038B543A4